MRVKIINKNSNEWFEIDEGAIYNQHKDETLDTATIKVSNLFVPLEIEPFDEVILEDEHFELNSDGNRWIYLCVDTPIETMNNIKPKTYSYEISLFSQTKELEGILLPNLKISRIWHDSPRTVYDYLFQYLIEYGQNIRVETGENTWSWQSRWHFSQRLIDRFNNIECPEMQWNQPTLKEVLNDLLMINDCIVVLRNNIIDYIDLTEINDNITEDSHINYITSSRSSEDYVSSLRMNMVNVTNNKTSDMLNYTVRGEYFSFTSDSAIINSNNIIIKTQLPIYSLKKLEIMFTCRIDYRCQGDDPNTNRYLDTWVKADLLDLPRTENGETYHQSYVYESKEWETKKIIIQNIGNVNWKERPKYKNYTLYWTRGSDTIQGFDQTTKGIFFQDYFLIEMLKKYVIESDTVWNELIENFDPTLTKVSPWDVKPYYNGMFYIEYETLEGSVFEAGKGDYPEHKRVIQDNQTNSYVDCYSQGILEYMKANRLGNLQKMINARFYDDAFVNTTMTPSPNIDYVIKLGDKYDDSVIYSVQYQIYKHHVEVNAQATKNYVLRDYYTGIKAKLRSWKVADGNEALTRHDLIKYYCELSYDSHIDSIGDAADYSMAPYFITSLISNNNVSPLKYCLVQTYDENANVYPTNDDSDNPTYYSMDMISRVIGNSLCFTFCFKDNYWVGKYIDRGVSNISRHYDYPYCEIVTSTVAGGIPTQYYKYVDDNGENYGGTLIFCNDLDECNGLCPVPYPGMEIGDNSSDTLQYTKQLIASSYMKPRVLESAYKGSGYDYSKFSIPFTFAKDSQEITNLTTQFEFCTDTNDITFTKAFIERQEAVRTVANNHTFRAYLSNEYDFRKPALPDDVSTAIQILASTTSLGTNSSVQLNISFRDQSYVYPADARSHMESLLEDYNTIYITDENDVVLLVLHNCDNISYSGTAGQYYGAVYICMNILLDRNKNIYKSDKITIKNKI